MGEIAKLPQHQAPVELAADIIESLVIDGDIGKLKPPQRVAYYLHRCRVLGIDPGEQPFEVINLSGKIRLYCTKAGANALTRVNKLSVEIRSTSVDGTLVTVVARATAPDGRFADDIGVLDLDEEMKGRLKMSKSNAMMKCATKAKRRAVLALVGLGVLDESEADDIRGARRVRLDVQTGEIGPAEHAEEPAAIDVEVSDGPAEVGPRCSGKSAGIADSIDRKIAQIADIMDRPKSTIWGSVIRKIDVAKYGEELRGPASLTVDDGITIRELLAAKLAELANGTAQAGGGTASEDGHRSPSQQAREPVADSAHDRVLTLWRALDPDGEVTAEDRDRHFADLIGLSRWPDKPSVPHWDAVEAALLDRRRERGAKA